MKKRISTLMAVTVIFGLSFAAVPAATAASQSASKVSNSLEVSDVSSGQKASAADVAELEELQRIAGQPVTYEPAAGNGAITSRAVDPFICTLSPSVVHPRTSSGKASVGAKPYTTCTAGTPSVITHTSTLYMVEWAGLSYVQMAAKTQTGSNTRSLTLTTLEFFCKNKNNSKFVQKTNGSSVQAGKTYYANVATPNVTLPCGK